MAGDVRIFAPGGYRFICMQDVVHCSGGIAAEPGHAIERARFLEPLPVADAFAAIEAHLRALGRPTTALAHCELRVPAPFVDQAFHDFNEPYIARLVQWGICRKGEPANPVARASVCPMYDKPAVPSMYAFSYTVPADKAVGAGFFTAGCSEARQVKGPYREKIVALGDTSPEGLRAKVDFVVGGLQARLDALGVSWREAGATQLYTVQNVGHLVGEFARRGAMRGGLVWHYARPPVAGLEYEMDVRGAVRELVL